jgi:hypothetical protein
MIQVTTTILIKFKNDNSDQVSFSLSLSGEANVYTLGDVGKHRVVTTKLPMTGNTRDALIATGSTTTRLLGTFQVSYLANFISCYSIKYDLNMQKIG